MIESQGGAIDCVLFKLGILDLERSLVEMLEKTGHVDGAVDTHRSAIKARVQESARHADVSDRPEIQICVEFGTLSVLAMLCEVLIAWDVLDPESLIEAVTRKAKFWRSNKAVYRALPAEILREALAAMAAEKRDFDQRIAASRDAIRSGRVQ